MNLPDLEFDTCPETQDEQPVILYDNGSRECYHCGADMSESK